MLGRTVAPLRRRSAFSKRSQCIWLWGFVTLATVIASQGSPATTNTIEEFKHYLSARPHVADVRFETRTLERLSIPNGTPPNAEPPAQFYAAAIQETNFFLRRLEDYNQAESLIATDSFTSGFLFAGTAMKRSWHIVNRTLYESTTESSDPNDFARDTSKNGLAILTSILNLGVEYLSPRTLQWNNLEFHALTTGGQKMHGRLEVSNDLPFRLLAFFEGRDYHYELELHYLSERERLHHGVPNSVRQIFVQRNKETPQQQFWIKQLLFASTNLPSSYFEPERFFSVPFDRVVFSNGARYHIDLQGARALRQPSSASLARRRLILAALVIVTLLVVVYFLRHATKNQRDTTTTND